MDGRGRRVLGGSAKGKRSGLFETAFVQRSLGVELFRRERVAPEDHPSRDEVQHSRYLKKLLQPSRAWNLNLGQLRRENQRRRATRVFGGTYFPITTFL